MSCKYYLMEMCVMQVLFDGKYYLMCVSCKYYLMEMCAMQVLFDGDVCHASII